MSEDRGQRTDVRCQRTEDRCQRTETRCRRVDFRGKSSNKDYERSKLEIRAPCLEYEGILANNRRQTVKKTGQSTENRTIYLRIRC
jgi:hypothetical protein